MLMKYRLQKYEELLNEISLSYLLIIWYDEVLISK